MITEPVLAKETTTILTKDVVEDSETTTLLPFGHRFDDKVDQTTVVPIDASPITTTLLPDIETTQSADVEEVIIETTTIAGRYLHMHIYVELVCSMKRMKNFKFNSHFDM